MTENAYINRVASYLPNTPICNEDMEDYIGLIGGKPSRVRSIVLRQNGIKTRYYGLNKEHQITHSNACLAKEAVEISVVVHFAVKFWFAGGDESEEPIRSTSATCENVSESLVTFDLIDDNTKKAVNEYLEGVILESIQGR